MMLSVGRGSRPRKARCFEVADRGRGGGGGGGGGGGPGPCGVLVRQGDLLHASLQVVTAAVASPTSSSLDSCAAANP